jgi:hypothetical protein
MKTRLIAASIFVVLFAFVSTNSFSQEKSAARINHQAIAAIKKLQMRTKTANAAISMVMPAAIHP